MWVTISAMSSSFVRLSPISTLTLIPPKPKRHANPHLTASILPSLSSSDLNVEEMSREQLIDIVNGLRLKLRPKSAKKNRRLIATLNPNPKPSFSSASLQSSFSSNALSSMGSEYSELSSARSNSSSLSDDFAENDEEDEETDVRRFYLRPLSAYR